MIIRVNKAYDGRDFRGIFDFHYKETARRVVEEVLRTENCPFEAEVDITIVDGEAIRELNSRMRGIDSETDVLSFPMVAYDRPGDISSLKAGDAETFDPENGALMLGDIVINAARVRDQAAAYGHSRRREWAFLIAHSLLHLTGYDHMTPEEAAIMEKKQETVLKNLQINREVTT